MDEEATADISPDSTTVVFAFGALKRVPIEGGASVVLKNKLDQTEFVPSARSSHSSEVHAT